MDRALTFENGLGEIINLNAAPYLHLKGKRGALMPSFDFVEERVPGLPGSRFNEIRTNPRETVIPLGIQANSEAATIEALRLLLQTLNPLKGIGKLTSVDATGSSRELRCIYAGGLEEEQSGWLYWKKGLLVVRAFDPYWYDIIDTINNFSTSVGTVATFFPFFPLKLTASEVFNQVSVNNLGDAPTWPVWRITGPGVNLRLINLTTGRSLTFNYTISAGEVVTIDTNPGAKSVVNNNGSNLFSLLDGTSDLWQVVLGGNDISIEMAGASLASLVSLTYRKRYHSW